MIRILVVEDSPDQATMIVGLLENEGYKVALARHGREAVAAMNSDPCNLVLTDLHMPEMDGLELVTTLTQSFPRVPVILMTAFGTEEIAAEALRRGAVSYIPKSQLLDDLATLVEVQADILEADRDRSIAISYLIRSDMTFQLGNETNMIGALVSFLDEAIATTLGRDRDDVHLFQIGTALSEAILNAVHHGNLELDSSLREQDAQAYLDCAKERAKQPPYRDRIVRVDVSISREAVEFTIEDEGPGFDVESRPDPTLPEQLVKASGRGLYLISSFMDEVSHNAKGNSINMVKRFSETTNTEG